MKWALVYWTETNDVTVMMDQFITDKSMLSDPKKVGMVKYGCVGEKAPKGGWDSYRARVLAVSEKKNEILKMERSFLTESACTDSDEEEAVPSKKRRKADEQHVHAVAEEEHSDGAAAALSKKKVAKAEHSAMQNLLKKIKDDAQAKEVAKDIHVTDSESESESDSDWDQNLNPKTDISAWSRKRLIATVKKQQLELARRQVPNKDIIDTIRCTIQRCLEKRVTSPPKGPPPAAVVPVATPPARTCNSPPAHNPPPPSPSPSPSDSCAIDTSRYLSAAQSVLLSNTREWSKIVCTMMPFLFSVEEMSTSLVSGKRLKKEAQGKPILDQDRVDFIVAYTLTRCPEVRAADIKAKMGQKIKDVRVGQRRQERKQ